MKGSCLGDIFQLVGEARGLTELRIQDSRGLESILGSTRTQQEGSPVSFSTIEVVVLKLRHLPDLRSISKSGVPCSFCNLQNIFVYRCPKLKVGFPFAEQLQFPVLDEIEIEKCAEMEEIFESNKGTLSRILVDLPKLRRLVLCNLPKLKVIFPVAEQLQLPVLSRCVEECEEVEETLGSNTAILSGPILSLSLRKLEDLYLEDLPNIKVIFPFTEELHLPNLESITVSCCEQVEEIFESNKAHSKPILSLPKLNFLLISDLPKLGSVYRGRLRCTSLVNPLNLIINGCPKLKWWRLLEGDLISDETMLKLNDVGVPTANSSSRS